MRKLPAIAFFTAAVLLSSAAPAGAAAGASGGFAVSRIALGLSARAVTADQATGIVYVAGGGGAVTVLDSATNLVVGTISVPMFPRDITVNAATDTVYAVGDSPPEVAVINGATDSVASTVSLPANGLPGGVTVDPATQVLYVADVFGECVYVISAVSGKVTAIIPLGAEPSGIAVDPVTDQVYVSDVSDDVLVIDGATNTVTHRIALPAAAYPRGIAIGNGAVYVADQDVNAVSVIDASTDTVSATITGLTAPSAVALGPAGTLYAVTGEGGPADLGVTYVIDTASDDVIAQIPRGGEWVAVDSGSAYLTNGYASLSWSATVITPSSATTLCPVLLYPGFATFAPGQARQVQLNASAVPAASFSATGLPSWATLSPSGLLSGTPPVGTSGQVMATVTVSNGVSPPDTEPFAISVDTQPEITSAAQATFRTGVRGVFHVTATGWPTPQFSETGPLPEGVTLSPSGLLTGVPAKYTGGLYRLTLTASSPFAQTALAFTLTVNQPPAFSSSNRVTFRAGRHKTFRILTSGYPAARLAISGKLPGGISFRRGPGGSATLSGTPWRRTRHRTFTVELTASNGSAHAAHQKLTVVVK